MAHEIHIDGEVLKELENRAVKEGRAFVTPNQVLRCILGLDQSPISTVAPAPPTLDNAHSASDPLSGSTDPLSSVRTHQRIGPRLLKEHGLDCQKGYYSKTGIPYTRPSGFPAVFFDPDGYLIIDDETSMRSNPYIHVGVQASVPRGISSAPGYVRCGHIHE